MPVGFKIGRKFSTLRKFGRLNYFTQSVLTMTDVLIGLVCAALVMLAGYVIQRFGFTARAHRVHLPIAQAAPSTTCSSCAHFDLDLGQREMKRVPPFWMAAQTVDPWRMGRVLKADADGAPLPFDQQDLDPKLLELTWDEAGACKSHREIRFARQPNCERYTPKS